MKVRQWQHEGVNPDGTFHNGLGGVGTKARVTWSAGGGCGIRGCRCSSGIWLCVSEGRTEEGTIRGLTIDFATKAQLGEALAKIGTDPIPVDEALRRLAPEHAETARA